MSEQTAAGVAGEPPGETFALPPRYRLIRRLGSGGMGHVALVRDRELDRSVALKILRPTLQLDRVVLERFRREAQVMARVDHPNLAKVFGFEAEPSPYLVMEYVQGADLETCLDAGGRLVGDDVLSLAEPLAAAIDALHAAGVLHRDIKPHNILIRAADGIPVLTDMGLAYLGDAPGLTGTHMVVGTPRYLPPEAVLDGAWCPASDVYQLAAVLYRALVGRPHVDGQTPGELAHKIAYAEFLPIPEDLPDVTPAIRRGIAAGLARNPQDRPESGAALVAMLRDRDEVPPPAADESVTRVLPRLHAVAREVAPPPPPPAGRLGWRPASLAALLLGGVLLGAWTAGGTAPPAPHPPAPSLDPSPAPEPPAPSPVPPGRVRARLEQHTDLVGGLAFSPDERWLVSIGADSSLGVWEVATGAPVGWRPPLESGLGFALAFSPGNRQVATGGFDGVVALRGLPEGAVVERLAPPAGAAPGLVRALAWAPDGSLRVAGDSGVVRDPRSGRTLDVGGPVRGLWALPTEELLAVAVGTEVRIVSWRDGTTRTRFRGHVRPVETLAVAPRGNRMASASREAVMLWDVATGALEATYRVAGGAVALDPDARWLAIPGPEAGTVQVRGIPQGEELAVLREHRQPISALAVAPGGTQLASADAGGTLVLWDMRLLGGTPPAPPGSQQGTQGDPRP